MADFDNDGTLVPEEPMYGPEPDPNDSLLDYRPAAVIKEAQKRLIAADAQGSIILNGKTSYSGADIKVVCHVYDNAEYAKIRIKDLDQQKEQLTTTYNRYYDMAHACSKDIIAGQTDPLNVRTFNYAVLQTEVAINTLDAIDQEIAELKISMANGVSTKVLAELQTLSVSTHREKTAVRSLSTAYPKGFTRGTRSIAGSMIFTVFDQNVLQEFLYTHPSDYDAHNPTTTALLDQIPPFDITVVFANELGQISRMTIYGVEFVNEGQTMSIEDMLIENVVQYVARDIDPMRLVGRRKLDVGNRMAQELVAVSGTSLLNDSVYDRYKQKLDPYARFKNRVNPFI